MQFDLITELEKLCKQMIDTARAKNHDYSKGDDPFKNLRRHGPYGIVVRMDDKISRLDSLTNPKYGEKVLAQVKNESVNDTALDLATYSLLFIALRNYLALTAAPPAKTHKISVLGYCLDCGESVLDLSPACSGIMKCESHQLAKPCGLCATQPPAK